MNKLKTRFLQKYNGLITILLTVLGFGTACNLTGCEYGTPAFEYGTPYATFIVKGDVKSAQNSTAIPKIRVVMNHDTAFTNVSGNYQLENIDFPEEQSFLVEFKDVDGSNNGDFQPLDTIVKFINPKFAGGSGSWDAGKTEKELNVFLKPKK
jgi:putative lipoprotein (rSAM/lipoprotein system)